MIFSIQKKTALIVGGTGDLGWAIAKGYFENGAIVYIIDINEPNESQRSFMKDFHVFFAKADITDRQQIYEAFDKIKQMSNGKIDILVNSAGIQRRSSSEDFPMEDWDDVLAINLTATFIFSKITAKLMIENSIKGKIINIASMQSFFGGLTIPAYAASKGGVALLTKAFSNDLAIKGLSVNAIAPGYMDTKLNTGLKNNSTRFNEVVSRIPMGRWGNPEDLIGLAIFLASSASDYLTGAVIPVDGGFSSR
jgi:2-deoxy-D-gluconate 3-dehydrogenase